jgi:nitroreductase
MIELLRKRGSIRRYTGEKLNKSHIDLRSPSSRNRNPWRFVFVADSLRLEMLSRGKPHGASFLKDAALGIVVCGDINVSDVWIEDCSIASILIQMTAQDLGLGSCWIQIRNRMYDNERSSEEYIRELLGIPRHICVESIISIGVPAESPAPISSESLDLSKIIFERFDKCDS